MAAIIKLRRLYFIGYSLGSVGAGAEEVGRSFLLGLHLRDLVDLSRLVVGGPVAGLLSILEIAGSHFCTVFAEPLPVAGHDVSQFLPFGPDGAGLVVVDVFFGLRLE